MTERTPYTFNGTPSGFLEINSRVVRCINQDGSVAWTNIFRTRREAEARYQGDLRAMRKNPSYGWPS